MPDNARAGPPGTALFVLKLSSWASLKKAKLLSQCPSGRMTFYLQHLTLAQNPAAFRNGIPA
ncbi:hypothetical protein [Serratia proteamaculans]